MGIGFVVGVFGVLILSHAAYSTIQYRALLKITEEEFSGPPINDFVNAGGHGVNSGISTMHVGRAYCSGKVPFHSSPF